MGEIKTKVTTQSARAFLEDVEPEDKRRDSLELLKIFEKITSEKAKMWGTAIVGFGMYHYKSERSSQEGDWPLTGFSPRKQALTLYLMDGFKSNQALLEKLGKHTVGRGCLYIKRLSDIDVVVLTNLIEVSYKQTKALHK